MKKVCCLILGLCFAPVFDLCAQTLPEAWQAYNQQRYGQALAMLETLVSREPDNSQAYLLLGYTSSKLEMWDKAISAFERVVSLDSQSVAAYIHLGFLYERKKDAPQAQRVWQKVLILATSDRAKQLAQKHLQNLK